MRVAELVIAAGAIAAVVLIGCLTLGGTSWPPRRNRNRRQS